MAGRTAMRAALMCGAGWFLELPIPGSDRHKRDHVRLECVYSVIQDLLPDVAVDRHHRGRRAGTARG